MDSKDFFNALKEASVKETIKGTVGKAVNWAQSHPEELLGGLAGGSMFGLGAYLSNRPNKKTGRSLEQGKSSDLKKPETGEGFASGVSRIFSNTKQELADLASKHPASMAAAMIPLGASAGAAIGAKLKQSSTESIMTPEEKFELADKWGRELARVDYEKRAASMASTVGKKIGELGKHVMRTDVGRRAAIGAAAGAGSELLSEKPSLGGAVGRAGVGAVAGAGAKPALKKLRKMDNPVGKGVAEGLKGWQKK